MMKIVVRYFRLVRERIVRETFPVLLYRGEVHCVIVLLFEIGEDLGPSLYRTEAPGEHCTDAQLFAFKFGGCRVLLVVDFKHRFDIDVGR